VKIVTIYHFAIATQKINKKVMKIATQKISKKVMKIATQKINKKVMKIATQKINKKVMKKNIGRPVHHIMINQVLEKIINQVIKNTKIV